MYKVVAILAAVSGLFGCNGPAGDVGPTGERGQMGEMGVPGTTGATGATGSAGADGVSCWDLDGDHQCSPTEDVDASGTCDAVDCTGPQGETGSAGPRGPAGFAVAYDDSGVFQPNMPANRDDGGGWDILATVTLPPGTYMINAQAWFSVFGTDLTAQIALQSPDGTLDVRFFQDFSSTPIRQVFTVMHTQTLTATTTIQFKCSLFHSTGSNPNFTRRVFQAIRVDSLNPAP